MRRNLLIVALALGFATTAHAEIDIASTRLGHDVEAWYVENDRVPVVDVLISFEGAGTVSDPDGKGGRAAFASAMLTEGAGTMSSQDFQRALDENAITIDTHAGIDRMTVHIHCLRDHAKRAGELLALALTQPTLTDTDIARIKTQIGSLFLRMEESPGYQAERLLDQRAFKGHPYANPAFGTPATVANLGAQDVRDYLNTYVTRGNIVIAAAGDVDSSLLDDMLRPTVDALKNNDAGPVAVTKTTPQGAGEILRKFQELPQTVIAFTAPGIERSDKRFYTAYLLNQILGGSALTSRLSDQVRQQKGLVYSIETELDPRLGASLLSGSLATRNSTADTALAEVKSVLQTMHDKGVTPEECDDAKSYVLGHFPLQLDGSNAVAEMLLMMQIQHLGKHYIADRVHYFKDISCNDVNSLAADMLSPDKFLFAIVGGTADGAAPPPTAGGHSDTR